MITRREFLADSLLAATAAAAAPLPTQAREVGRAGANDVVRLGIVGVRGRGRDLAGQWVGMKDVQIAAICDVDSNVIGPISKLIEDKGGKKPVYFQDVRKLLEDKSIDAVAVATCNHTHSLYGIWAMQAGKHAYVEKPVSHNIFEGRRLVDAARRYNRVCQGGTQRRSSDAHQKAFAFLKSGKIGPVKVGRGIVYRHRQPIGRKADGPVPPGVDYNLWLGPAPERPFNPNRFHYEWHWNWDYGGGDLANNGIHCLDAIRWAMGKSELPRRVMSVGGRYGFDDDGQTPNAQVTVLDYGDSVMVCEVRNLKSDPFITQEGLVIHAADGYIASIGSKVSAFTAKGELIEAFADGGSHTRNFIDAVKEGRREALNAEIAEGHVSTALCHLGNISWRLGEERTLAKDDPFGDCAPGNEAFRRMRDHLRGHGLDPARTPLRAGPWLTVDPKTEGFVGNAEADRLATREYRKPFVVPDRV